MLNQNWTVVCDRDDLGSKVVCYANETVKGTKRHAVMKFRMAGWRPRYFQKRERWFCPSCAPVVLPHLPKLPKYPC